MMMPLRVMRLRARAGQAGEIRQLGQRDVHAERARAAAIAVDARAEVGVGTCSGATSRSNSSFGLTLATTRARAIVSPLVEHDARGAARLDDHRAHRARRCGSSTPRAAHSAAIACVIAPMPPIAWPHCPRLPFTSPNT